MNQIYKFTCPKCGNKACSVGEIRTVGSLITKIFDIQNRRFTSVTCSRCKYTEFYNVPSKMISDVFDFFIG